ncbi:MAG: ADP-glyceromanno-heptose 6-epimerase [Nitrospirae bacterium]|jgi:ADP-L-glycero-D-manno-heptose 6-epimerase|nr:ADP-glyceromanno-heptose 6-epimerase [Nitrospirota bacterium]
MRYLVTGGAGFVGSNIVLRLEKDRHDVTVIDDMSSGTFKNLVSFRGDFHCGDISRMDLVDIFQKRPQFDAIIHEASITDTTVSDQRQMITRNVDGFRNVLSYATRYSCRVVYASSAAVYGNNASPQNEEQSPHPLNVYGFSKMLMDNMARKASHELSRPVIGLRYFNVFGPGEGHKGKFASMIYQLYLQMREGKNPRIFKWGEQGRDHVYVKDVVEANILALSAEESGIVNVGTGVETTFNDIVETLNRALKLQMTPDYFDNPYDFYQNHTRASVDGARSLLGYVPRFTVSEGIMDYVQYLEL